jgi:TolB-like protein/Tfp pilus assembly protein PilF
MREDNSSAGVPPAARVPAAEIEAQLDLILSSPQFIKSERMNRFLRFVVKQALQGSGNELKEYTIGVEVFDKDASFDPRIDNNVRTEARRLRTKLAEYYATSGKSDKVRIELPKGSYMPRFVETSRTVDAELHQEPLPQVPVRRSSTWRGVLAVLAVAALIAAGLLWSRSERARPPRKLRSIAVLPFRNLSAGEENEYFTEGLTEEILNHLAAVPALKVVARTSSAQFKNRNEDVRTIGKRLNVDTVLEGSVRRVGNVLRITPQLISTADGYHLWSQTFERDADNLFGIQDEISRLVVQALGPPSVAVATLRAPNPKAYRLCLQARYHWNKWNPEDVKRSIILLDQALEIDPLYARGYAWLASAYGVLGELGGAPAAEAAAKSRAAAQKAVDLDPGLADGYVVLACLKATRDQDWDGSRRDFEHALSLSPGTADIHNDYALLYLVPWLRLGEAEAEARKALELDPLSVRINQDLGSVLYFRRNYDAAIAQFREALDLDRNFGNASMQLFKCFLMKRQFAEAYRIIEPREKSPYPDEYALHMGRLQALRGNRAEARKLLDEVMQQCAVRCAVTPAQVAWLQVALGDTDGAFRSLARDSRNINLQADPVLDGLRSDPRYHELLVKMHFKN